MEKQIKLIDIRRNKSVSTTAVLPNKEVEVTPNLYDEHRGPDAEYLCGACRKFLGTLEINKNFFQYCPHCGTKIGW